LKQALIEAVDNFSQDVARTAIDEWRDRLCRRFQANGSHFELFLYFVVHYILLQLLNVVADVRAS